MGIGFSTQARLDGLRMELGLHFPLYSDPERRWYRALGAPRGSWRAVLAPRILRRYARAAVHGEGIPRPRDDLRQLGAGALLRDRQVVRAWVTDESERRPSVDEVLMAAGG